MAVAALIGGCAVAGPPTVAPSKQPAVQVLGAWSGTEEQSFARVLNRFEQETGYRVTYTPAPDGVPALLDADRAAGRLPDVAFLPQPGLLRQYADARLLVPLDDLVGAEVRRDYAATWQQLGTVDGHLYGVWFKAAEKSLVWYNIAAFEKAAVVPPHNFSGLIDVMTRLRDAGMAPLAIGGGSGWPLTDWFENIYLSLAGPQRYDLLAAHRIAWTDPSVKKALNLMAASLSNRFLSGGTRGAAGTDFAASVTDAFSSPPGAAMVFEGDFVAGAISGSTTAQVGVDADEFAFPPITSGSSYVVVGGDAAVLLSRSAGAAALMRYLASGPAAAEWARAGGFISPNLSLDPAVYPDQTSRAIAVNLLDAGDHLRFDLSDLQPASFGATAGQGMFRDLQEFLVHPNVDATAARLEADARADVGR